MENKELLLQTAVKAAVEAGAAIMNIYEQDFDVITKDDSSPLTQADQDANTIINKYLVETDIPIISEENKLIEYEQRKQWTHCWIVDPLDGTKEFVKRNGEFTVNIALVAYGKPVLGVIYVPCYNILYFADVETAKAYKTTLDSHHVSLQQMKDAPEIAPSVDAEVLRIVGSRSHLNDETKEFIDGLVTEKNKEIVSKGSSLKFCLVAEGAADVYPRFAPTMEWDTAAGQAICEAVGVQVVALPANSPLLYNKENLLNPWFLVSES